MKNSILVIGAGFAGAVYARTLTERGYEVSVIDKRPHVAGNAYDEVDSTGTRAHRYGPHLFHTSNQRVVDWLGRFTRLEPYEHKVEALLSDGRCVPLPINRRTINEIFGLRLDTPEAVCAFLQTQAEPHAVIRNAADHLVSQIGVTLTDLFFRPYTRKMWALDLENWMLPSSNASRCVMVTRTAISRMTPIRCYHGTATPRPSMSSSTIPASRFCSTPASSPPCRPAMRTASTACRSTNSFSSTKVRYRNGRSVSTTAKYPPPTCSAIHR
jgi:hypothetical protein